MRYLYTTVIALFILSCNGNKETATNSTENESSAFPYTVTEETPNRKGLSEAIDRSFKDYMAYRPEDSPLYSTFKYCDMEGFDYRDGDGTVSRRDPSKIVKANNKYYIWYTKRDTKCPPIGAQNAAKCDDTTPSTDWDLAEIWYATSSDGFTWQEQGVAVERAEKPNPGHRSVSTPDILVWKGKYYLYYQSFTEPSGLKGDYCPVSMSYADSPDGPWTHSNKIVIENGKEGEWDQFAIHDPYPLVHNGKIYIYYKSAFNRPNKLWVANGFVTGDNPEGPFTKSPKNPVLNSGHEVMVFPFKEGLAAVITSDGIERNTTQYSSDWENFHVEATIDFPPIAAGPYIEDAYTDTKYGKGISWGACHFVGVGTSKKYYSILSRFDCCLTTDNDEQAYKSTKNRYPKEVYYSRKLTTKERKEREERFKL